MKASSSSRVGTRPLAIGTRAWRSLVLALAFTLGFGGLALGGCLLLRGGRLRRIAGIVGGHGRLLPGAHRLGRLAALGDALGQQRHRLLDLSSSGLRSRGTVALIPACFTY